MLKKLKSLKVGIEVTEAFSKIQIQQNTAMNNFFWYKFILEM